jgi:hypothetical protein
MLNSLQWVKNAHKKLKANLSANVKFFSFLHIVEAVA